MYIVGIQEVDWFQAVDEMPLDWKRSVNAWVAVSRALNQAKHLAQFYFRGCGSDPERMKMCQHYVHELTRIKERNGLGMYIEKQGRWVKGETLFSLRMRMLKREED